MAVVPAGTDGEDIEILPSHDRRLNTFGYPDRRLPCDPSTFPAMAVGKVEFPGGKYCTGTLVGRALVLTSRHCFLDEHGKVVLSRMEGSFFVAFSHGSYAAVATFIHVWYGQDVNADWALIKLNRAIGDQVGFVNVSPVDARVALPPMNSLRMIAYSSDEYAFHAGIDPRCSLYKNAEIEEFVVTSCSGAAGASGGAVLNNATEVVALFAAAIDQTGPFPRAKVMGDIDPRFPNFAIPSSVFYEAWKELRQI